MEGHCSTGQSPQWAVVPMEEEEEGGEGEGGGGGEEEDYYVDLRKIFKKDLRWDGRVDWIYVTQDRDRDTCPYVVNTLLNLRVVYRWKLLAERLSVSEEGCSCVELVGFYL